MENNNNNNYPININILNNSSVEPQKMLQVVSKFWRDIDKKLKGTPVNDKFWGEFYLPLNRIKKIIKQDYPSASVPEEVQVVLTKAAELFIKELSIRSWQFTASDTSAKPTSKKNTIRAEDISQAVHSDPSFDFLVDIVPKTIKKRKIESKDKKFPSYPIPSFNLQHLEPPLYDILQQELSNQQKYLEIHPELYDHFLSFHTAQLQSLSFHMLKTQLLIRQLEESPPNE